MANSLSVKINLDASGYTSSIDQASESTKQYTNQVDKMSSKLPNAKKELSQTRREIQNIAAAYYSMSKSEQQSASGQALLQKMTEMEKRAGQLRDAVNDANTRIKYFASDTKGLDSMKQGFDLVGNSLGALQSGIALVTGDEKALKDAVAAFMVVQQTSNAITAITNALNKDSNLILGVQNVQRKAGLLALKLENATKSKNIVVTGAATVAQKALNAVMKANPIGLLITGLTAVIGLFALFSSKADEGTTSLKKQQEEVENLGKSFEEAKNKIGDAVGKNVSDLQTLALQWSTLRTEAEKTQWIENNKNAFEALGIKIMTVADANEVLMKQLPRMIQLMQKVGELRGLQAAYEEVQSDYFKWLINREKSRQTGDYYTRANEQNITKAEREALGIGTQKKVWEPNYASTVGAGTYVYAYEYSNAEIEKVNKYREKQAIETRDAMLKAAKDTYGAASAEYERLYKSLYGEVKQSQDELNDIFKKAGVGARVYDTSTTRSPYSTQKGGSKAVRSGKREVTRQERKQISSDAKDAKQEVKGEYDKLTERQQEVDKQRKDLMAKVANGTANEADLKNLDKLNNEYNELAEKLKMIDDLLKAAEGSKIQSQYAQISENVEKWNEELQKLQDGHGGWTDPVKAEDLISKINKGKDDLKGLEKQISDATQGTISYKEKLQRNIDDWKAAMDNLYDSNGQITDKAAWDDYANKIQNAAKEIENIEKIQKEATTAVEDPRLKYLDEEIEKLKNENINIKTQLEVNPDLSPLAKKKLNEQLSDNEMKINTLEVTADKILDIQAKITPEMSDEDVKKLEEQMFGSIEIPEVQVKVNVKQAREELEKIMPNVDLRSFTDRMSKPERDLYEVKSEVKNNSESNIQNVVQAFDAGLIGRDKAQEFIDAFNDQLKNVGLEPIKINLKKDELFSDLSDIGSKVNQVASSIGTALTAINEMFAAGGEEQDKGLAIGKIIAQAVANIALSFSQAMAKHKSATVWDWIAAGIAGTAQMVAMIAQIKKIQSSEGYAQGGIVGGHSYYGDKIIARLNSGEQILTRKQQESVWKDMNKNATYTQIQDRSPEKIIVEGRISGSDIILSNKNYNNKRLRAK